MVLPMICQVCKQPVKDLHFGQCHNCCGAPLCVAKRGQAKAAREARIVELTASREPAIAVPDSAVAEYLDGLERKRERNRLRDHFFSGLS